MFCENLTDIYYDGTEAQWAELLTENTNCQGAVWTGTRDDEHIDLIENIDGVYTYENGDGETVYAMDYTGEGGLNQPLFDATVHFKDEFSAELDSEDNSIVKVNVFGYDDSSKIAQVAAYDENGKLVEYKTAEEFTFDNVYTANIKLESTDVASVKVMLWDSINAIKPLEKAVEITY